MRQLLSCRRKGGNVLIRRGGVKRPGWGLGAAAAGRYSLQKEVGLQNGWCRRSPQAMRTLCQEEEMRFLLLLKERFLWQCREPCAQRICWDWRGQCECRISKKAASSISSPTAATPQLFHSAVLSLVICFHSHAVASASRINLNEPSHWSISHKCSRSNNFTSWSCYC